MTYVSKGTSDPALIRLRQRLLEQGTYKDWKRIYEETNGYIRVWSVAILAVTAASLAIQAWWLFLVIPACFGFIWYYVERRNSAILEMNKLVEKQ